MKKHDIIRRLLAKARLYRSAPELLSALETTYQALLEVAHAQSAGANWYTNGERGLNQQINMWVAKGTKSARAAITKAKGKGA